MIKRKITVVVDLYDTKLLDKHGSPERGLYGVNHEGVYHNWYGCLTYLVKFSSPTRCEYCNDILCKCEEIIDQNIQAQERTGQW